MQGNTIYNLVFVQFSAHGEYSISIGLYRVLEVDPATFYNYYFHRVHKTKYAIKDELLRPKIAEIFEKSYQRFGAKKVLTKLQEQGYKSSTDKKITQLMKEMRVNLQLAKKETFLCKSIFIYPNGNMILPNYVTQSMGKVIRKHKLKEIRFHDLRHSCASLMLAEGVPMKQIQEWLGHASFKTKTII